MTKNLLLGSTALVGAFALAAPAYADIEVTLSGQVEFGAKVGEGDTNDEGGRGYFFFMDSETKIEAEGAADNGINYSAKVELETDADIQDVNADETVLSFWGGFGRIELGREDGAADNMFVGGEDFQAGTGGIDGDATNLDLPGVQDTDDAAKVTYFTPRVAGFQLGASYVVDTTDAEEDQDDNDVGDFENVVELGANFVQPFGGADVTMTAVGTLGNAEVGDEDLRDLGIGGGIEFGGLGIGGGYIYQDDADEGNGFTAGMKYGFGPANVSVGYAYNNPDGGGNNNNILTFSADYGLFPGVTAKGDFAYNSDDVDDDGDDTTAGVVTIQLDY